MNGNRPMTDNDVLRALGDSVSGMPIAQPPPVEMIKARGRAHRRRKLIPGVAGALAVVAGAAVVVTALVPASHQPSHPVRAHLTAWTVVKQADGKIYLTLRQFRDPAGLQARLRADDIPASVTLASQPNPACHGYPLKGSQESQRALQSGVVALPQGRPVVAIINPSVLPGRAGIQMLITLGRNDTVSQGAVGLVLASPQCTGS
jgi:hypothetical protein